MLLTPHIVRTPEITEADLRPIYIGSQQNLGLGGPPPLIARRRLPRPRRRRRAGRHPPAPGLPPIGDARRGTIAVPPGATPIPGTVVVPNPPPAPTPRACAAAGTAGCSRRRRRRRRRQARAARPRRPPPAPAAAAGAGGRRRRRRRPASASAQVIISPPAPAFRVAAGPVQRPDLDHRRSAAVDGDVDVTFDPAILRVRTVQEGSFLRSGGANVDVLAAGRRRPHRHHDRARRRRDRGVRHGPAGRGSVRRHRAGHRDADDQRRRQPAPATRRWVCSSVR